MALVIDFIAIIFIILLSFLFCNSNSKIKNSVNNSSCFLSHIVVGLSVIMFYILAKRIKLDDIINSKFSNNNENFYGSMNDFINGKSDLLSTQQASTLKPIDLTIYSSKLDTIINSLKELQKTDLSNDPLANTNPSNLNSLDLASQQQYQMFQIDYLNKQIQNVQDTITAQNISDTTTNYKPIKVFSSCMVANANGTTTADIPVSNSFQNVGSNIISSNSTNNAINNATNNAINNATNNMLNTISQSNDNTNSQLQDSNLSTKTGIFSNFLSGIQKNGTLNINM
jgi:hypothetical protein